MKNPFRNIPLRWRIFLASTITITVLFAVAGWLLEQYAIGVADESVRTEIRASIQAYEAIWKTRTQVLSVTSALMASMPDVRAAFETHDPKTIRDSAQELWGRVSGTSALFLVLDPEGHLISSLGSGEDALPVSAIPLHAVAARFPRQVPGYVRVENKLFYIVLTPVYVQTSGDPLLLNVLCAGFPIDDYLVKQLHQIAPGSEFAFAGKGAVFASTVASTTARQLPEASGPQGERVWLGRFIVSQQALRDVTGRTVGCLYVLHSYEHVKRALGRLQRSLAVAWIITIITALLFSLYMTKRLLEPVKLLDRAATEIANGNYQYRVPLEGTDELSRLGATFNHMCQSIEHTQSELIRQEQLSTIGRLGSSLVHDLRNPLAAIYGGAEMLVDGQLPADHTRRIAMNIYRGCQRVQELLRDLLLVSRGQKSREPEFCRLREMVEAAAEASNCDMNQVRVSVEVDDYLEVFGDRTRIERVFTNLLSNAVEAMPAGGEIAIEALNKNGVIEVWVQDTGPGVPSEIAPNLFRPFVTGKRSGLGLGLSLSRQTMLEMGGDLIFSAPRNGCGARFGLRFTRTASMVKSLTSNPSNEATRRG